MEKIDLRTAKPGDRFETVDGRIVTYAGSNDTLTHTHAIKFACGGRGTRTDSGAVAGYIPCDGDLIRKLPPETPAQSRDDLTATDTPENDATALSGPHSANDGHPSATDDIYAALAAAIAQQTGQPLSVATAKAVAAHMADALGYEPFVGGQ